MARHTVTVCPRPGCPELRPCPVEGHEPQPWAGSNRRAELPKDWPRRRARILKRDGYRCTHTEDGRRCLADATDVHHVGDRDDHDETNLASLCAPHHWAETAAEAAQARRR